NTASRLLACLAVAAIAPSPESTVAAQQLTAPERAATVASVWAEARYNFAYWDRVRADWDSGLVANLKLAAEPQSDLLFYRRLRRLLALLADGRAASHAVSASPAACRSTTAGRSTRRRSPRSRYRVASPSCGSPPWGTKKWCASSTARFPTSPACRDWCWTCAAPRTARLNSPTR